MICLSVFVLGQAAAFLVAAGTGEGVLLIVGIAALVAFVAGFAVAYSDTSKRKEQLDQQQLAVRELHEKCEKLEISTKAQQRAIEQMLQECREFGESLRSGILSGRSWLANAFAEYVEMRDLEVECWLAVKPHPAWSASQTVASIRDKHREAVRALKLLEYQLASYEEYFPFLAEYRDAILDEAVDLREAAEEELDKCDPTLSKGFLTKEEFGKLSNAEKFQLALDRYWNGSKSTFEIGRVYERFWGGRYERDGWRVTYFGVLKGKEDFGRDLICERGSEVHIVQCKCWAKDKVIREKHIFQLFGTALLYQLQNPGKQVTAVFASTAALSPEASMVASELEMQIRTEPLQWYPMIKCNVSKATNEKIYHLPFDQQYDRVVIGDVQGEFHASTIAEAEAAGFRRAWRWQPQETGAS